MTKEMQRKELETAKAAYLAAGKVITICPPALSKRKVGKAIPDPVFFARYPSR